MFALWLESVSMPSFLPLLLLPLFLSPSLCGTVTGYIIPHSHCDAGWLQTFTQYYTQNVSQTLANVVAELQKSPSRRFVWSEVSYLSIWWKSASPSMRDSLRSLVDNGQFEFVGGGWVQSDESVTDSVGLTHQYTIGHQWLLRTFGEKAIPSSSWQIDPFGASRCVRVLCAHVYMRLCVYMRVCDL